MKHTILPQRLQDVSKHRQFLYGFAALWIMFYHMGTKVPSSGIWKPLSFFQSTGAGGVEIFLLLTGLGLYNSMKKNPSISAFYTKRFMRVAVPSAIVMALCNIFTNQKLTGYLGSITFFGYWLGAWTVWYVAFILTMYLLYPVLFKVQNKYPKVFAGGIVFTLILTFVLESIPQSTSPEVLRAVSRIPVFLAGCAIAPWVEQNRRLPRWALPVSILVTVPLMMLCYRMFSEGYLYSFRAAAYFAFAVTLVLILSALAELLSKSGVGCILYRCFAFCGCISLEIYLLFERLLSIFSKLPGFSVHACGGAKLDVASAICTIILSVALQQVTEGMRQRFSAVHVPKRVDQ